MRAGIFLFDDVELLDFAGPFEVLSVTRLDETKRREEKSPFDVFTFSRAGEAIRTTGGLVVLPDHSFETTPPADLLLIPGGIGTRPLLRHDGTIEWFRRRLPETPLVASVCTGALILAACGMLHGRKATTHRNAFELLRELSPQTEIITDKNFVEDRNIITSAGIAAGIDLALFLVKKFFGEPVARATAAHMEYPYNETNSRSGTPHP